MDLGDFRAVHAELAHIDAALKRLHWDLQRAERLHANGLGGAKPNRQRDALTIRAVTPEGVVEVAGAARGPADAKAPARKRARGRAKRR